jgi:hypothetical protein
MIMRPDLVVRFEVADQLAERDLPFVLIAVIAGHQEDSRPRAILDAGDGDILGLGASVSPLPRTTPRLRSRRLCGPSEDGNDAAHRRAQILSRAHRLRRTGISPQAVGNWRRRLAAERAAFGGRSSRVDRESRPRPRAA